MRITKSLVEKITISDPDNFWVDPINVFFEDYGSNPNRGKVTIETSGDAWSYFFGNIANSSVKEFFMQADTDYLVRKFKSGIQKEIDDKEDAEAIREKARKYILFRRKEKDLSKEEAREQWNLAENIYGEYGDEEILCKIYGGEWYLEYPQIPNPKYNHLYKIVETIKKSVREDQQNTLV